VTMGKAPSGQATIEGLTDAGRAALRGR
jgi:hypothetical protein